MPPAFFPDPLRLTAGTFALGMDLLVGEIGQGRMKRCVDESARYDALTRVLQWEAPRPEDGRQVGMPEDSYSEIPFGELIRQREPTYRAKSACHAMMTNVFPYQNA